MPEAISYVRWSSQEQGKGNSEVRQTEGAAKWLKEHPNYILNRRLRFRDAGVSGRGDHMEGALGAFRDAAISKKVFKPGTVLLVEALDRLGRMEPVDQLTLFLQIITTAEIIVVTTMDGEEYSRETMKGASGQMRLMKSLMKMHLAWEESDKKSERSGDNWKRIRSGEKKKVGTKCVPGWIGISSNGERYELKPERVRVVREIFELTVAGWGKDRIAKKLRDDKVECWGIRLKKATRWRDSYVAKILANPAVIGQFQWHKSPTYDSKTGKKVREPIGDPQDNFFPAAIKHSLWAAVKKIRASRASRPGRVGTEVRNLFTGLVYCGHTGDTMCFSNKTPHYYIKSSALKAPKGVRLKPWIYDDFEEAFFSFVGRLDPSGLVEPSSAPEREALLERIAELGSAKESLTKKIDRLIDLEKATKSIPEVGASLNAANDERSVVTAQIADLKQSLESLAGTDVTVNEALASIQAVREKRKHPASRLRLRDYLAGLVDGIFVYLDGEAACEKAVGACFNFSRGGKAIEALSLYLEQSSVPEKKRAPDNARNAARVRAFSIAFKTGVTRTVIVTQKRNRASYAFVLTGKRSKIVRENRLTKLYREDDKKSGAWMWEDAINLLSSDFSSNKEFIDFVKSYREVYPIRPPEKAKARS